MQPQSNVMMSITSCVACYSPRVWRLYPDVLAVQLVPDVAVGGRDLAPVIPLGRGGRGPVPQEHPVLLVT